VAAKGVTAYSSQNVWDWPTGTCKPLFSLQHQDWRYLLVKTKAYWNKFDNDLVSYSNPGCDSEHAAGFTASITITRSEPASRLGPSSPAWTQLKPCWNNRFDAHNASEQYYGFKAITDASPTSSVTSSHHHVARGHLLGRGRKHLSATPQIDLVQGFGYDWRHLRQAQDFNSSLSAPTLAAPYHSASSIIRLPTPARRASKARRSTISQIRKRPISTFRIATRFPTLFERFSSRFGSSIANPNLEPERAINFDLGWSSNSLRAPRCRWTCSTT